MRNTALTMTRRTLMAAGAAGAAMAASLSGGPVAAADAMTAAEKANADVVTNFLKAWEGKGVDADKLGTFLADDCSTRMSVTGPAAVGRTASVDSFKPLVKGPMTFSIKVLRLYAKGPVVVTTRVDTGIVPGKPDQPFPVVGVFYVKDGKIKEWTDYPISKS